jgi:hypothetical protein
VAPGESHVKAQAKGWLGLSTKGIQKKEDSGSIGKEGAASKKVERQRT